MRMTIINRIPTHDVVIDGLQPDVPSTAASAVHRENLDEQTISSLMHIWQTSTNANAEDRKDILYTIVRICGSKELTVSCLYKLTSRGRSYVLAELSVPDPKRDWYTDNTPLIMEAEQAEDNNIKQK